MTAGHVKRATTNDTILSHVLQFTKNRWPAAAVDESLQAFFNKHQEITVEGGCLLWGIQVIVPERLQKRILDELHMDHLDM